MTLLAHFFTAIFAPVVALSGFFFGNHEIPKTAIAPVAIEISASTTVTATSTRPSLMEENKGAVNTPVVTSKTATKLSAGSSVSWVNDTVTSPTPALVIQPKTSVITLPSGAVVETDANGNLLRTIKEAPVSYQAPTQTTQTAAAQPAAAITINAVSVSATISSATISWETNVPTDSKVFITDTNGTTSVHPSESGLSTRHLAKFSVAEGASFSYQIEAIAQNTVAKKEGSFTSDTKKPTSIVLKTSESVQVHGGNCEPSAFTVAVLDQYGNAMNGQPVSMFNSETQELSGRTTNSGSASFSYAPQMKSGAMKLNFYIGNPPVTPSIMTSVAVTVIPMPDYAFDSTHVRTDESGKTFMLNTGGRVDLSTQTCL